MGQALLVPLLTSAGASAATAATVASVAGYASTAFSVLQGVGQYRQGNALAKAEARNASVNAQYERDRLSVEQTQRKRELDKLRGAQRVSAARTGAQLGSFDTLLDDSTEQGLLDIALAEYDSKVKISQNNYSSGIRQTEYRSQAQSSLLSNLGKAGESAYATYGYQRDYETRRKTETARKRL